jgi:putative protease
MSNARLSELLAPAGSADAAWAAFSYGANAVYAGLPRFSARAEADNLSVPQLDELIGFAHAHDRKVYLTFNTLVQQHELPDALEALALIHDLNADGIIVQDMGIARMVKRCFPRLALHASTQLAVHNTAGAQLLADLGFSRVVLARELSLKEIQTITRDCGIETEVFIHGALCYSYSGLCLFSSHLTGRSGNRGRCAYCCRQTFNADGGQRLPFAMKDFAVGESFEELLAAGVSSLKIEGRMKGPAYVGAVTDFYRRRMDRGLTETEQHQLLADIQTIFGRPSTDLYLQDSHASPIDSTTNGHRGALIGTVERIFNERGARWIGFHTHRALMKHDGLKIEPAQRKEPFNFFAREIRLSGDRSKRLKFEVPANTEIEVQLPPDHPFIETGQPLYCSASQEVRQRYGFEAPRPGTYRQQQPFDAAVELTADRLKLSAQADGITAELQLEESLSAARNPDKTEAAIRKSFEKTGGTEWTLRALDIRDNGYFAPASILNEARRQLLDKLSTALAEQKQLAHFERLEALIQTPAEPNTEERWSIRLRDLSLLDELSEEELSGLEVVLENADAKPNDDSEAGSIVYKKRIAIPVIQRGEDYASRITNYETSVEVANVGALQAFRACTDLTADWPLYTLNSEAADQWRELGIQQNVLSPEDTGDNLKTLLSLLGDRAIVPVYQHTPLMISATKPDAGDTLTDRKKKPMRIERNGGQYILIYEAPFALIEHLDELRTAGARNFRIDLSYGVDGAAHAAEIIRSAMAGRPVAGSYDGNYPRTL